MSVAIIDYGSGNLRSAAKAFERAARDGGHGCDIAVTSDPDKVRAAERIVLPGVGAFADCKAGLEALDGMEDALTEAVFAHKKPFLGICVGMQLMAKEGFEHGKTNGLAWLNAQIVALEPRGDESPAGTGYRVPHMGWNELNFTHPHPIFAGLENGSHAYFVHSYHMTCENDSDVLATASYGQRVTAAVGRDNIVGTQFHPEKSQALGLKLISNFLAWAP